MTCFNLACCSASNTTAWTRLRATSPPAPHRLTTGKTYQTFTAIRSDGLLVLLFAQPCSRIVRLTTDHVQGDDTHVTLTLGAKPVQLPPPVDDLLTQLVQRRRDTGTGWLFPGAVAGQPFNAEQLTRRLNSIGVRVRAARNTTMIDLAGDVPAVVLSHLLGLHVRTTTDWVRIAGAPRAEYAADISQRETFRKL